ncbi:MAG: NAD(P)H-binding protein [Anaerolineae bacterium]|nr:NAD(P)H-binding protein [Anaerolineae bacterium]
MILVTGAAGFVGRHLVQQLIQQEHAVRVLLPLKRYPRLPWPEDPGLEVLDGSIFSAGGTAPRPAWSAYGVSPGQRPMVGNLRALETIDLAGTRNLLLAARAARIGRVITLSHIGAESASGFALLRVKGQVEDAVRRSGLAYTIFRCGVLFGPEDRFVNNLAMLLHTNPFMAFQPGAAEALLHPLHIQDLTQALVNSLEAPDLVDNILEIGGAEYMTYNEMIRTVMRVTGAQRQIIHLPPYALRALNRATRRLVPRWPITAQWYDLVAGNRTADLRNLYSYTGVSARRFEDTLLTYMPQRRYALELPRFLLRRRPRPRF